MVFPLTFFFDIFLSPPSFSLSLENRTSIPLAPGALFVFVSGILTAGEEEAKRRDIGEEEAEGGGQKTEAFQNPPEIARLCFSLSMLRVASCDFTTTFLFFFFCVRTVR